MASLKEDIPTNTSEDVGFKSLGQKNILPSSNEKLPFASLNLFEISNSSSRYIASSADKLIVGDIQVLREFIQNEAETSREELDTLFEETVSDVVFVAFDNEQQPMFMTKTGNLTTLNKNIFESVGEPVALGKSIRTVRMINEYLWILDDNNKLFTLDLKTKQLSECIVENVNAFDISKNILYVLLNTTTDNIQLFNMNDTSTTLAKFTTPEDVQEALVDDALVGISLNALSNRELLIVYGNEISPEEEEVMYDQKMYLGKLDESYKTLEFHETFDIAPAYGTVVRYPFFYNVSLHGLVDDMPTINVIGSSSASELSVYDATEVIQPAQDSERAVLPISKDTDNDTTPTGLSLDTSTTGTITDVCLGVDSVEKLPLLYILNNEGDLQITGFFHASAIKQNKFHVTNILPAEETMDSQVNSDIKSDENKENALSDVQKNSEPTKPSVASPQFSFGNSTPFGGANKSTIDNPFTSTDNSSVESPFSKLSFGSKTEQSSVDNASKNTEQPKPFSFGQTSGTNSTFGASAFGQANSTKPAFSFSGNMEPNKNEESTSSEQKGVSPSKTSASAFAGFGQKNGSSQTPTFGFGSSTSTNASFGKPAFGSPAFGSAVGSEKSAFATTNNTTTPSFGNSSFGAASTTEKSAFGTANGSVTPAFGKPAFGASIESAAPSFGETTAGSAATSEKSTFGKPIFGSTPTTSTPSFGSTSFGTVSGNQKPAFGKPAFGSSDNNTTPSFGTPSFGSAAATSKPQFGASSFGSTAFGAASAATSTFGSLKSNNDNPSADKTDMKSVFGNLKTADSPFSMASKADSPFASLNLGKSPFDNISKGTSPFASLNKETTPPLKDGNIEGKDEEVSGDNNVESSNESDEDNSSDKDTSHSEAINDTAQGIQSDSEVASEDTVAENAEIKSEDNVNETENDKSSAIESLMDRIKKSANIEPDKLVSPSITSSISANTTKSASPFSAFTETIRKPSTSLGSFSMGDNPAFSFSSAKEPTGTVTELPQDDSDEEKLEKDDEAALENLTLNDKKPMEDEKPITEISEVQTDADEDGNDSDLEVIEKTKSMEDITVASPDIIEDNHATSDEHATQDTESDNEMDESSEDLDTVSDKEEANEDKSAQEEEIIEQQTEQEDDDIESFEDLTGVIDSDAERDVAEIAVSTEVESLDAKISTEEDVTASISVEVQTQAIEYDEKATQSIAPVNAKMQTEAVDSCDFKIQSFEGSESYLAEQYKPKPLKNYYTNAEIGSIPSMATNGVLRSMEKTYHMIEAELSVLNDNIDNLDIFFKDQCTLELEKRTTESLPNQYTWRLPEAERLQKIVNELTPGYTKNGDDLDSLFEKLSDFTMKVLKSHSEMDELKEFIYQVEYLANTALDNKHRSLSLHQSKMQTRLRQKMSKINDELQCVNKSLDVLKMYVSKDNAVERAVLLDKLTESKAKHEELLDYLQKLQQQSQELVKMKTSDPSGDSYDIAREEITSMEIVDLGMQINAKREIGSFFKQLHK